MMNSIEPQIASRKKRIAEDQEEYEPITVVIADNKQYTAHEFAGQRWYNTVIMAFEPTEKDRERIAKGAPIYVALLTYGRPQPPILVTSDVHEMAEMHGLLAEPTAVDPGGDIVELLTKREARLSQSPDLDAQQQADGLTDAEGTEDPNKL